MSGLTSVNLGPKARKMTNNYPSFELNSWTNLIDEWLNENYEPGTYFANRFMRFNFKYQEDALGFKIRWL